MIKTGMDDTDKFERIPDEDLLTLVQKQTFKYFWDFGHEYSGMARERTTSGDVVTTGGTGFGVMAMLVAAERGFITRQQAVERVQKIVTFLDKECTAYHGAYAHWINGATGATKPFSEKDNGADLVETSLLFQGLLAARAYFKENTEVESRLRADITRLWEAIDWTWFRKNGEDVLYWHWSPDYGFEKNLAIRGWNECLITYILAASSPTHAPVIGASVVIKGTVSGASTDVNGVTTIACPDDAVLSVSYVGYSTQEVAVASRTTIEVRLEEDAQRLDEVVVVGYNTVRRAQTTGALSQVKGEKLEFQSSPTLENRLQGQTPGVMISSGSGQPGSNDLSIRIRGTGSINGSNTPLYIMDGVMVQSADFAALNSNDIADIQVLKDASATAIYGSRGANGVIVITTKSGRSGRTNINYRNQFGFSFLVDYIDMMNSEQNLQYQLQCVMSEPNSNFYPMMQYLKREMDGTASEADLARLAKARATDTRSEERRVGKECRSRWSLYH